MKPPAAAAQPLAPPLSAWAIAGVLGLLVGIGSYVHMREHPPPEIREGVDHEALQAQLARLTNARAGPARLVKPLVLALGTSLFDAAFPGEGRMARFVAMNTSFDIDFEYLLAYRVGTTHQLIPYFDQLMATRPDVVVIEDKVLLWFEARESAGLLADHRRYLAGVLRDLIGARDLAFADRPRAGENKWDDFKRLGPRTTPADMAVAIERLKSRRELFRLGRLMESWDGCPDHLPAPVEHFLAAARERGTTVLLLHISVANEVAAIEPPELELCRGELAARLEREHGVLFWWSPKMPTERYVDFLHYDVEGRKTFLTWFIPRLGELLERRRVRVQ